MTAMGRFLSVALSLLLAFSIGACRDREKAPTGPHRLQVVTTLFPVYDFARIIGGEKAEVRLLLPPGVEPHNYEPKPEEVARIGRADLFVYTDRYMEPWAADLLKGVGGGRAPRVVEAGSGANFLSANGEEVGHAEHHHDHGTMDPHIWLDPENARLMVAAIAAAMAEKDPANAAYYRGNAARYEGELTRLDERFRAGLANCRQHTFLHGGHYAFAYLARRYGLTYRSAYALSANAEPTPQRLVELVREMRSQRLKYIFYEELLSPAVAQTIARETGGTLLRLHGIHNVSKADLERGASYLSLMEENLNNLRTGLECR
ncbi:MAG TPA: zinc ABC transporter substrate-binding protein [Geobacteraceae bacterium]